jgi:hypothetical protein
MNGRTVLLCGRSLLLSGVAASLEQCAGLRTTQATDWSEAGRLMREQPPDVLIFDLTGGCEGQILSLLLTNPTVLMIGLDPESNRAVVVSGHEARSLTLNQIQHIVLQSPTAGTADAKEEGNEAPEPL